MKMNKAVLIITFCFGLSALSAQPYRKFLDTKGWLVLMDMPHTGGSVPNYWIINDGDTMINGTYYSMLGQHNSNIPGNPAVQYTIVREDTVMRKVYIFHDSSETLMFSFGDTTAGITDTLYGQPVVLDSVVIRTGPSGLYRLFCFQTHSIAEGVGQIDPGGIFDGDWILSFLGCAYNQNGQTVYGVYRSNSCANPFTIGIHEVNASPLQLKIYPNPSNGKFIAVSEYSLSHTTVSVINLLGQTLFRQDEVSGNSIEVNIAGTSQGLVFIRIEYKDGYVYSQKLLME